MLRTIVNSGSLPTVDASSSDPAADLKPLLVTASQLKQWQDCVTGKQLTPLTTINHRVPPVYHTGVHTHSHLSPFLFFSVGGCVDQRQERAGVDHGPKERQRIGGTATPGTPLSHTQIPVLIHTSISFCFLGNDCHV